ncbi:MAG: hypothetical protein V2I43_17995 [Parvularcula sp.]|jgi:hypothetical protein|nr:hypothetical protein [Parvularcula sp.]
MENEKIIHLYNNDAAATAILDHFATRKRNQAETKVDRMMSVLTQEGYNLSRGDVVRVFRELEACGCGQFRVGRHGWPSRILWDIQITDLGKLASGEDTQVESISISEIDEEETTSLYTFTHTLKLREDFDVEFELPTDLTPNEAKRLALFVQALPLEDE